MQNQDLTFIQQQANDWIVKLETGAMGDGDEDRFVAWLEQNETHGQAFAQAEQTWKLMHQVPSAQLAKSSEVTIQSASRSRTLKLVLPLAATVLLSVFGMLWWKDVYFSVFADHYTATGQRIEQTLSDGTVLTLNTDSAVDIRFDEQQRLVKLLSGEIYVDVAPSAQQPFVVAAGNLRITALGTEFIVNRDLKKGPKVTVTEHSVSVQSTSSPNTQAVLQQGQQISLIEARDVLTLVEEVNTNHAQAWRQGKYVFQDEPLEKVIIELNRYYSGKLVLRGKNLQSLRLSGVLNLEDPIVSLQGLTASLPIKIRKLTPYLILLEKG